MYKNKDMIPKIFALVLVLVGIGIMYTYSITLPIALSHNQPTTYYSSRYILNAAISVVISVLFYYGLNLINKTERDQSIIYIILFFASIIFLMLPLFLGKEINGARRWIAFPGIGQVQPSELIRPIMIVILSKLYFDYDEDKKAVLRVFLFVTGAFFITVLLQRSNTSAIQLAAIGYLMYCMTKVPEKHKIIVGVVSIITAGLALLYKLYNAKDYSTSRITGFFSVNQPSQVKAAELAIKSGGILGRGVGEGYQKYYYLAEAHNDYVFSAIAEEGGFVWSIILLLIFALLIFLLFWTAYSLKYSMYKYMAYGVAFNIADQTIGHLAINLNLIPSTGITLPFISYGGSSFMANLMCIALVFFAINEANKEEK